MPKQTRHRDWVSMIVAQFVDSCLFGIHWAKCGHLRLAKFYQAPALDHDENTPCQPAQERDLSRTLWSCLRPQLIRCLHPLQSKADHRVTTWQRRLTIKIIKLGRRTKVLYWGAGRARARHLARHLRGAHERPLRKRTVFANDPRMARLWSTARSAECGQFLCSDLFPSC